MERSDVTETKNTPEKGDKADVRSLHHRLGTFPRGFWNQARPLVHTLYRQEGETTRFCHFIEFSDRILVQRGIVGTLAERHYLARAERQACFEEVAALLAQGYVDSRSYPAFRMMSVRESLSPSFASLGDAAAKAAIRAQMTDALADRGLGYLQNVSIDQDVVTITLRVIAPRKTYAMMRDLGLISENTPFEAGADAGHLIHNG